MVLRIGCWPTVPCCFVARSRTHFGVLGVLGAGDPGCRFAQPPATLCDPSGIAPLSFHALCGDNPYVKQSESKGDRGEDSKAGRVQLACLSSLRSPLSALFASRTVCLPRFSCATTSLPRRLQHEQLRKPHAQITTVDSRETVCL